MATAPNLAPAPALAAPTAPLPQLASVPAGALMAALLEADATEHLTPALLLRADNAELFSLLPLVLSVVQRVGETPGARAPFGRLARALRARVTACRAVKLRLLLLCATPGFADFWKLRIVHRAECYGAARTALLAALAALEEDGGGTAGAELADLAMSTGSLLRVSSDGLGGALPAAGAGDGGGNGSVAGTPRTGLPGGGVSREAMQWKSDTSALVRFAVFQLFDGEKGVPLRSHQRHLRAVPDSFLASELVDTVMEFGNYAARADAVVIGRKLQNLRLISRPPARSHAHHTSHNQHHRRLLRDFADDDTLWVSSAVEHGRDGRHACITDRAGAKMQCWTMAETSEGVEAYSRTELKIACDIVDLQSMDFFKNSVYARDVEKGHTYGYRAVAHPMAYCALGAAMLEAADDGSDSDRSGTSSGQCVPGLVEGGGLGAPVGVVTSVKVVKVFSSIARPMIVQLRSVAEGGEMFADDDHAASDPMLVVKEGDNLGQDLTVELLFRCFNCVWQNSLELFPDPKIAPFSFTYEVFPTAPKQGFMEAVAGLTSLKDFDWDHWVATYGKDKAVVQEMVSSAAGSYIGAYILGAQDRHPENVNIIDGKTMMHLDFGFLVGSAPPIDGPQVAIYPAMEAALRKVGAWDTFCDTCESAYIAIRRAAPAIVRTAVLLLTKFGFTTQQVRDYISGPLSLNMREDDELVAGAHVKNLVKHSSQHWKTKFKSYSHEKIDPAFYSLLQARFGPAVFAMKIVDAKQQGASEKLEKSIGERKDVPLARLASIDE